MTLLRLWLERTPIVSEPPAGKAWRRGEQPVEFRTRISADDRDFLDAMTAPTQQVLGPMSDAAYYRRIVQLGIAGHREWLLSSVGLVLPQPLPEQARYSFR